MTKGCLWHLADSKPSQPHLCGKTVVKKRGKNTSFCAVHTAQADAQEIEEEKAESHNDKA